jgi:FlaA1/EpsC-like NDP-sugar epimerase
LKRGSVVEYKPIGFVDDDPTKIGMKIHGLKVLGSIDLLPNLIQRYNVNTVLIAIPSARGPTIERIVHKCCECKIEFKILQGIAARINGQPTREIRNLRTEDLLGREPIQLDLESIRHKLQGKVLLITGAGGSIGSELCRQAAGFEPKALVLYDRSENDLFKISTELSSTFPQLRHSAVVGDILDVSQLRETFAFYRPDSVFHAAAYKHVPMMETNCFQAVTNNIFGTYNVSLISRSFQVQDFVLISSDKAVNPSNIMGVTKRISELIVLALHDAGTRFVAVRFGNVLDSNGSVLPLFKRQVASGGPLLVTHPEATRYFMTIPEAVQLVVQASSLGRGGEIFVLKMGNPVRIVDLAKNVIRLSGYEPGREIKILYTGLRPGEKLCEELLFDREGIRPTAHEKVSVVEGDHVDFVQVRSWLEDLSTIVETKNVNTLVAKLGEIVPEYCPSKELLALCEVYRHDMAYQYRHASARLVAVAEADAA